MNKNGKSMHIRHLLPFQGNEQILIFFGMNKSVCIAIAAAQWTLPLSIK